MQTFKRICLTDTVLEAQNGDRQVLQRGEEYITSPEDAKGNVVVFDRFWARFPVALFAGAVEFTPPNTGEPHGS